MLDRPYSDHFTVYAKVQSLCGTLKLTYVNNTYAFK